VGVENIWTIYGIYGIYGLKKGKVQEGGRN
jgi:hypothetical protein